MSKITQLTEATNPSSGDDLVEIVIDTATTPLSRKMKFLNLLRRVFLGDGTQLTITTVADGEFLKRSGTNILGASPGGGGLGDVVGPASATDNAIARYDLTTGKLIQNSTVMLDDAGALTVPEIAAPSTPASGKVAIYAKTDSKLYIKDDTGTETDLTAAGGGGSGSFSGTSAFRLLPYDQLPSSDVGALVGANEVYVLKFFLPMELTVASVHFSINTTSAGSNVAIGVYSADGNTLHVDSGPVSGATGGIKSVTLGSTATLPAGFYWFAWTATDGTVRLSAIQTSLPWYNIMIGGTLQEGKGANASSSGNLPATLGAISTSGQTPVPIAKLQG